MSTRAITILDLLDRSRRRSHDMGWGVEDDETYENVVEDRLNRELGPLTGKKFEIMNFSFRGYSPTQKLAVIEQRMFSYRPGVALYVANTTEFQWMFRSASKLARNALLERFPYVGDESNERDLLPRCFPRTTFSCASWLPLEKMLSRLCYAASASARLPGVPVQYLFCLKPPRTVEPVNRNSTVW